MKKFTLMAVAVFALGLTSCKKDFVCECTNTYTSSGGTTTTDPAANVTYRDVKKGEAKSLCQKTTVVNVGAGGGTSTEVNDCKLK